MKKIIIVTLSLFIVISALYLVASNYKPYKKPHKPYDTTEIDSLALVSKKINNIKNIDIFGKAGEKYTLKEKLDKKLKMIIVFPIFENRKDVEYVFETLNEYGTKIGYENIMLLTEFKDNYDFRKFEKDIDLKISLFRIAPKKGFILPINKLEIPYLIMTNQSLKPLDVFAIVRENSGNTKKRFNMMSSFYF